MTNFRIDPKGLAFDIDGVIADTMTLFLDIARDEYRLKGLRYEDITCYTLEECLGIEPDIIDAIIKQIQDGNHRSALKAIDGSPEVLTRLGRKYAPILFVTARPYIGPILEWIQRLLPLKPDAVEVIATGSFESKIEILLSRGISCFVEDRLDTCFLLEKAGIRPVLFRQPWNRESHPFTEVGNWKELESLIEF